MNDRVLLILLVLFGQAACASAVPLPFLLVTERVDGLVTDGVTGQAVPNAKVCITFQARETALIESLAPDRFGYTNGLAGTGVGPSDATGAFGVRAMIPHFSPIGWSEGWDHLLVEANGYGPLVARRVRRQAEGEVAILQGASPNDPTRRATLETLQLLPSNSGRPSAAGTPADWMKSFCPSDRMPTEKRTDD